MNGNINSDIGEQNG